MGYSPQSSVPILEMHSAGEPELICSWGTTLTLNPSSLKSVVPLCYLLALLCAHVGTSLLLTPPEYATDVVELSLIFQKPLIYGLYLRVMPLTSKAVSMLEIV